MRPKIEFIDLLPLPYEADKTYIGFEVVSGADWLNEGIPNRGSNCTSIDALIYALDVEGKKWLIPIEWKYTEHYTVQDKGSEADGKGETRHARYDALIQHSKFLKPQTKAVGSIYYQEPFYQLMRQTLWAEQSFIRPLLRLNLNYKPNSIPKNNFRLMPCCTCISFLVRISM
ncbi:PGN_0703 family putative restriction endonuclease [Porphyromonas macacae]|uniref:PGN_0703 family putative restriction endonuclease n=1 Tax=Porphyromonas macacae TaxID=28115 RepID=UPI000E0FC97B|nr:hypothetical protein [Porphyromonas macacae]